MNYDAILVFISEISENSIYPLANRIKILYNIFI